MEPTRQGISRAGQSDNWLVSIVIIAALLFAFGLIAEEVVEGEPLAFDRTVMLALRDAANPSIPIEPPWLLEAARDVTSLGSTIVRGIVLFAVVGYLLLDRERAAALLMLGAVLGGVALNHRALSGEREIGIGAKGSVLIVHAATAISTRVRGPEGNSYNLISVAGNRLSVSVMAWFANRGFYESRVLSFQLQDGRWQPA